MDSQKSGSSAERDSDGTVHVTDWDANSNMRYSRDIDSDGNCTNRHIVDQDDGEILNLPDCHEHDDDMSNENS